MEGSRGSKPGLIFVGKPFRPMVLSYSWLMEYLPVELPHAKLSTILNSIGLEVEGYERFEEVPGSLEGLIIGKVLEVTQHPQADRLKLTRVDLGQAEPVQIVCGAPNVAAGQTVLVAPVGATIHPVGKEPFTLGTATIRGVKSHGMICAEDEVGLGESHAGIMVLPDGLAPGMPAADHFKPFSDHVISIGLTPNRSDAMSHLGVARDICAWLAHHEGLQATPRSPLDATSSPGSKGAPMPVTVESPEACARYTGIRISSVRVAESPEWLKRRLRAIGQRPINNIVDATNYVLHETGQPLHAFDADNISGSAIRVMKLPTGTPFTGLDGKERRLDAGDLMICDAHGRPLCMGGVFGGTDSGVTESTRELFLESAWFHPTGIRKTSFRHGLRTDAAMHFEKGVDIGRTLDVLHRAAKLICELSGGHVSSEPVDVYPTPTIPRTVGFGFRQIDGLSGKAYPPDTVRRILGALGFRILLEDAVGMTVEVPLHKTDITMPADIAEEIMRIDGFDNIPIPTRIIYSPAAETLHDREVLREKVSAALAGTGFREMLNNSITSSTQQRPEDIRDAVRMINSLSAELDILRVSMLETGLRTVARNLNHRNLDLRLFEFGKTYRTEPDGSFSEHDHLAVFTSGQLRPQTWNQPIRSFDLFHLKGTLTSIFQLLGLPEATWSPANPDGRLDNRVTAHIGGLSVAEAGRVSGETAERFDVRQETWYADIDWEACLRLASEVRIRYRELPRFPSVSRDLAIVVDKSLPYERVRAVTDTLRLPKLKAYALFDVFESDRLGPDRKSLAISFSFRDDETTLTDTEVEAMMERIVRAYQQELGAQVRT
jgi:phenylalanyl-tRNA synthetase beta chain